MGDVFPEGRYDGLDVAISDAQLGKLLGYQILDTGYCSMNVLNLGNWSVATCHVQQGNLETATLSMFNRVGVKLGCCDMSCPIRESGDCTIFNVQQGRGF